MGKGRRLDAVGVGWGCSGGRGRATAVTAVSCFLGRGVSVWCNQKTGQNPTSTKSLFPTYFRGERCAETEYDLRI